MRWLTRYSLPLLASFIGCSGLTITGSKAVTSPDAATSDTFLWLEEIEGPDALQWVETRNDETLTEFQSDSRYPGFLKKAESILNATDRIPYGTERGGYVYNFWQDTSHVRGIWRRAPIESYRSDSVTWETLLDMDAIAAAENENWVYKGVHCLSPKFDRCLLRLSRGGKDASVYREFDIPSRSFVPDGFNLPEAKSDVEWLGANTLLVGTDWGPGTMTASGYPKIVKKWHRGTPLREAQMVMAGIEEDIGVWPGTLNDGQSSLPLLTRSLTFFTAEYFFLTPQGNLAKLPLQESVELTSYYQGKVIFSLRESWNHRDHLYPEGSLLAFEAAHFQTNGTLPEIEVLFTPNKQTSIEDVVASRSGLYVTLLQDVKSKVLRFELNEEGSWKNDALALPSAGSISISSASPFSDVVFFNYEDHITPDRLFEFSPGTNSLAVIKTLPSRFDASELAVAQHFVKSEDGETIPYFLIHRRDAPPTGSTPTILYGYGGFEISLTPRYSSVAGKLWLERGGAFAVANIRGGGEYGPRWHKAALKQNRQRAFDDFIAVAKDLIHREVTSPAHLGIMGGSNGGLLVGVAFTQHPELFNAVVCQVPLLDMYRYTKLLAGASWAAEYGDPADPQMWDAISQYSPYQNLNRNKAYPHVFLLTSTKDDRVHPGHARKMVAKMRNQGHPVYYYENTEGGHSAGANLKQHAMRYALEYVYLSRQLGLQ